MSDKLNRHYIETKLDSILHAMTTKVFMENPEDHIEFMLQYLRDNHGKRAGINTNERKELEMLRKEVLQIKNQLSESSHSKESAGASSDSDLDQISSEEDKEDVAELAQLKPVVSVKRGPRTSVSAEAFGNWNKKEDFKPPFFEKTASVKQAL